MTNANTTRFAARAAAALLAAAAAAGLAGTAAHATAPLPMPTPITPQPAAPAATPLSMPTPITPQPAAAGQSSDAAQNPQFWASGVNLHFVNKTDMTFTYRAESMDATTKTVRPGETVHVPANDTDSRSMSLFTADRGTQMKLTVFNHAIGTPEARVGLGVGSQEASRSEHQGTDEHDVMVSLSGLTISSYRGADDKGKNFTFTLDKAGAAVATADNTASPRNTFVYTNGAMVPVAKGTKAAVGQLERGKDTQLQFTRAGVPADIKVTWVNHVAQFSGHGHTAALAQGESATFGYVTVTRTDNNLAAQTAYTYTFR